MHSNTVSVRGNRAKKGEILIKNHIAMAKLEVNEFELFGIDVESNKLIKSYRKSLGLETPNNRIDTGDLRCILSALNKLGFSITRG